jgi:hypothetical protein
MNPISVTPADVIDMSPLAATEWNELPSATKSLPAVAVDELINVNSLVPMVSAAISKAPAASSVASPPIATLWKALPPAISNLPAVAVAESTSVKSVN